MTNKEMLNAMDLSYRLALEVAQYAIDTDTDFDALLITLSEYFKDIASTSKNVMIVGMEEGETE